MSLSMTDPLTEADLDPTERDVSAMWPTDAQQRAALWNAAMARGVRRFWIDAGRPELADEVVVDIAVANIKRRVAA